MVQTPGSEGETQTIEAICPSCGQLSRFTFLGEQRWPKAVADAAGMPEVTRLYLCSACQSSISLPPLEDETLP